MRMTKRKKEQRMEIPLSSGIMPEAKGVMYFGSSPTLP